MWDIKILFFLFISATFSHFRPLWAPFGRNKAERSFSFSQTAMQPFYAWKRWQQGSFYFKIAVPHCWCANSLNEFVFYKKCHLTKRRVFLDEHSVQLFLE